MENKPETTWLERNLVGILIETAGVLFPIISLFATGEIKLVYIVIAALFVAVGFNLIFDNNPEDSPVPASSLKV